MPLENYVIGDVIGKGSYGEVTLATNKKDKKKYVIKKIDLHNATKKERTFAQQEVEILSKLRHPNIVSYKESFQTEDGHLSIVMGYCEGGDLYARLKKQAKQSEYLSETQIVEWFVQIAMALQYIHDRNILHRDLKTQNIFLTKSKIIKLGDLGIARVLDNNCDMATTLIGTPYYMSPELFSNKPYNHKSDVWALGCCVYEMATLKHAFNAKDMNSLVYKILKGKTPTMPKYYSEELLDIIRSMLKYEPSSRPSASRILRHPFIKKHIAIFLEGTKNRQKGKSRDETKKIVQKEAKVPPPVEEPTEETNSEGLVTASKVDIELVEDEKQSNRKITSNIVYNNNNNISNDESKQIRRSRDIEINGQEARSPEKRTSPTSSTDCHDRDVSSRESNKDYTKPRSKKITDSSSSGAVKNPAQVRKILHDRMQAKARLKEKRSMELQKKKSLDEERVSSASSVEERGDGSSGKVTNERRAPPSKKSERSRRPLPVLQVDAEEEKKPALPPPRFKKDADKKQQTQVNKEEKNGPNEDNPKVSAGVPNMAARRKRRQKQRESQPQFSPPPPEKIESVALSRVSHPRKSREEIIRSHLKRNSMQQEEKDVVDGPQQSVFHQISNEESSSENDEVTNPSSASHGKGSDVMNLIDTLQATLKLDVSVSSRKSPEESAEYSEEAISPSVSGRLKDRIVRLRRECIEGVGLEDLKEAYLIIDNFSEEEAEAKMRKLLGDRFEDFSGRIWQLKFCEEFR